MKYYFVLISTMLVAGCLGVSAQSLIVSGSVAGPDGPVSDAWVAEVDVNNRTLNSACTDTQGLFTLKVKGGRTYLRITAPGMQRITQKIGSKRSFKVVMEKAPEVDLTDRFSRANVETTKLLYGISQMHRISQWTWLEQVNDTLFAISVPVRVSSGVEEYPAGRQMQILDGRGAIMVTCSNMFTEIAYEGTPDTYEAHVQVKSNNGNINSTLSGDVDRDYFCYPRFLISKTDIEYVIDHADDISRFAVDTSRGNNYWILYPDRQFGPELQKMVNKLMK